jgi:hypothetical protein
MGDSDSVIHLDISLLRETGSVNISNIKDQWRLPNLATMSPTDTQFWGRSGTRTRKSTVVRVVGFEAIDSLQFGRPK